MMVGLALAVAYVFSLPNGIRVAVRRTPGSALFSACLLYRCGVEEEQKEPGLRAVAARAMLQAASGQVARVESLGGRVELDLGLDYVAFKVTAPLSASTDALLTLSAIASGPTSDEGQFERAREGALRELRRRLEMPFDFAMVALRKGLYGDGPYGLPEWGTEEGIRGATPKGVKRFAGARLVPKRGFLGVACDMPVPELVKLLRATLGLVEGGEPAPEPEPPRASRKGNGLTVREGPGRLARVVVGFPAPSASSPEFPAAKVVSALLGGGLGGVVARRLRGEMGLAYRVISLCPALEGEGFIAVYAEVEPLKAKEATEAILSAVSEVTAGNISPSDIVRAKNRAIGEELLPLQSQSELAFRMALWEALGLGADFEKKFAEAVDALSPEDVLGAARKYLSRCHIAVILPRIGEAARAPVIGPAIAVGGPDVWGR